MTAKEKVLKVWPDARVFQLSPGIWVSAHGDDPDNPGYAILGKDCDSEEAAWQNAAESLPTQPGQILDGLGEALQRGEVFAQEIGADVPEHVWDEFGLGKVESLPVEAKDSVCCFITCNKAATWQAWDGPQHDDYTEACGDHLGHLLSEKPEHRVWPLTTAEPKPTPSTPTESTPERVQVALRRIMNRVEVISEAGEFDVRDSQFVENELLDVWDHHSIKPQPDSSSIPEQTFEQQLMDEQYKTVEYNTAWQAAIDLGDADELAFHTGFEQGWNAAKGLK